MARRPKDALERHYTPDRLAGLCLARLPDYHRPLVIEPSCGGGAFIRAAHERWPGCTVIGIDIDPAAAGLADADVALRLPFEPLSRRQIRQVIESNQGWSTVIAVGNLPFSTARSHLDLALSIGCSRVSTILPLSVIEGVGQWRGIHAPISVDPIEGRPWPKRTRGTGLWTWGVAPGEYRVREMIRGWR